jgi:type IV pilus assembly protein PilV
MNTSNSFASRSRRRTKGFTLLEVLIALLVLSIGLLGLAGLQAFSMRNNQSANYRTQATNLAYQIADLARSYRGAADPSSDPNNHANLRRLISGFEGGFAGADTVDTSVDCSTDNAVDCDRMRWVSALAASLPGARARIRFGGITGSATDGAVTIEICWTDDRSQDVTPTSDCTGDSEGYGQPTVGPDGSDWPNNAYWMVTRI